MPVVKVSSKYQIIIPKTVREAFKIHPGQELHIYVLDGHIHLSKPRPITALRGLAKGMRWKGEERDHTERF
jgi:AbrB family looped-hinge helix DNA binding protein